MSDPQRAVLTTQLTEYLGWTLQSLRGFYHQHVARNVCETQGPASVALKHLNAAAAAYIQAAEIYPEDDEKYVCALHSSAMTPCAPEELTLYLQ